jgi:hypothetical protein
MTLINWLSERIRYFAMWPINLVRDLPVRFIRLLQTAERFILGILFFLPELIDAIGYKETRRWVSYKL